MKLLSSVIAIAIFLATSIYPQTPMELSAIWESQHTTRVLPSNLRHSGLKQELQKLQRNGIEIVPVGKSTEERDIYRIKWGKGPIKVFLWSQMHGDEPTATSALIDIFAILQRNRRLAWVKKLEKSVSIRAVPMLNPDGAEVYRRGNKNGVDINRDAISLETPEARLLKSLRDEWQPDIGFNLHNQQALTTVGNTAKQAAISLLVVYGDAEKTTSAGHERNQRLAGGMVAAINEFIPGHIGKYDDEFTETAFGDNFSKWGTPTILIETGALYGQSEMALVKINFVAILTALNALANGKEKDFDASLYSQLPDNSTGKLANYIFRNVTIKKQETFAETQTVDIAANAERRRAEQVSPVLIWKIGDLSELFALEDYDASGFYVIGRTPLASGGAAELLFYKKGRTIDWTAADIEKIFPPDAIFLRGKWLKGKTVVPRK